VRSRRAVNGAHGGFSLVETMVGLTLLAFGLSGLITMIVVSSRQLEVVEERTPENRVLHLVPDGSDWAVRLGAAARIVSESPTTRPRARRGCAPPPLAVISYCHSRSTGEIAIEIEVGKAVK
jgi:hypothetical protein